MNPLRLVIADDHPIFRAGLRAVLARSPEIQVVGEAGDGAEALDQVRQFKPDIAIEFRQPYNGPLMRKYGNMLRGVDCPNAGAASRKETIDLRPPAGPPRFTAA